MQRELRVIASTAFVMLAALFWGMSGGIGSMLMANGWDAFLVSFYRGFIGLLFILIWLLLRPAQSGFSNRRLWFWSAIAGIGVAGNFAFYFASIFQGSVAVAATLMYCAPVFVYLLSFVLKLEKPTALKWAAMALVMLGVVLLTQLYAISSSGLTLLGVVFGLLAGLSYAIFIFGFKYAAPHGSPQAILSIAFAVLVLVLLLPSSDEQMVRALVSEDKLLFFTLGIFGAGLSFVLYIIGLRHTAPTMASMVAMVEPITATLFGVVLLNENLEGVQLVGMGLILTTVTALSITSRT